MTELVRSWVETANDPESPFPLNNLPFGVFSKGAAPRCAVAIGASRKSFIGRVACAKKPCNRLPGSIAATMIALSRGVQIHRVHDVAEARQAIAVWSACNSGDGRP